MDGWAALLHKASLLIILLSGCAAEWKYTLAGFGLETNANFHLFLPEVGSPQAQVSLSAILQMEMHPFADG